jgi:LysM repeat protein
MMFKRLSSPYLPDSDHSDYLIAQYQDVLDVCNATNNMPELVIRAPPDYATATPPPLNFSNIPTDTSCTGGQYIVGSTLDPNANCATISQAFNVATGDVQAATNSSDCKSTSNFCLPASCKLYTVASGDTCASLASSFSTTNLSVSTMQLLSWNPNINGLCDSLNPGDNVCSSPPGGTYVPPPPPPGSASDGNQQRGGGDSSTGNINSTLLCTAQQSLASPVQGGISSTCTKWCQAVAGDYCYHFAQSANITTDILYTLNTVLGNGGSQCSQQFQAQYWYCVAAPGVSPTTGAGSPPATTTQPSPSKTSSVTIPSPTQSGITPNCNKYQQAHTGDYCYKFAGDNGITTDQLYAWNKILGDGGVNCSSNFQATYWYCVGVSS